jgi:hypothetical protein
MKEAESINEPQNDSMVLITQINATPIKQQDQTNFLNDSSFFHSSNANTKPYLENR